MQEKIKCQPVYGFHYPLPPIKQTMVLKPLENAYALNLSYLKKKAQEFF